MALGLQGSPSENRRILARQTRLLRHRGPDSTTIWQSSNGECVYCFERLHIIDPSESGRYAYVRIGAFGALPAWDPRLLVDAEPWQVYLEVPLLQPADAKVVSYTPMAATAEPASVSAGNLST